MKVKNIALVFVLLCIASFFLNAGLTWAVCWGFGWTWSWKLSTAVWALEWLLSLTFKSRGER